MKEYKVCNIPLTEVQGYLFDILMEFDRICRKHHIRYTLEGGTLLGAVKYGGFVPWDDDLDIVMLREEYEKFLKVCKTELSDVFFVQNSNTEKEFPLNYTKLRYKDTKYVQKNYEFLDINQGLFMDIYPYDYVGKNTYRFKMLFIGLLSGAKMTKLEVLLSPLHKNKKISFYKKALYKLVSLLPLDTINRLIHWIMQSKKERKYVFNLCNPLYSEKPLESVEFNEYTELTFNKFNFMAIRNYHKWLNDVFGDYMKEEPEEETRGPSHAISECRLPYERTGKIGILTFHRADNYGAVLQSYALSHAVDEIIRENGNEYVCEIVDYINDTIEKRYAVRLLSEIKRLKTKVKYFILRKKLLRNGRNFRIFRNTYLNLSKKKYTRNNIGDAGREYKALIVGSDQVWNGLLTDNDGTYFLDIEGCSCRKISYAASAGSEKYFLSRLNEYKPLIDDFDFISVREEELFRIMKEAGYDETVKVSDPVFLLNRDKYSLIESNKNLIEGKYILLYVIAYEKEVYEFARKLALEKGLKIAYINTDKLKSPGVINLSDVSVEHFLTLIKNAEFVVTSSFHGVAFSLIYNKEFYYKLSHHEDNFNSRINTLIEEMEIKKREITNGKELTQKSIDWEKINEKMANIRNKSLDFLKESVLKYEE